MRVTDISAWLNIINKFFIIRDKVEKNKSKPKTKITHKIKGF